MKFISCKNKQSKTINDKILFFLFDIRKHFKKLDSLLLYINVYLMALILDSFMILFKPPTFFPDNV